MSSMLDDRVDLFFGEGFHDGISLSGVVSLHPSLYFSAPFVYPVVFCFLILFLMSLFSSRYCLCASSLVVLFFLALVCGRKA